MTVHERLLENLTAGALDTADRAHAARCPACAALLAGQASGAAPARTEWLAAAHQELARPARPWWGLAAGLAAANAALAAATTVLLVPTNWKASTSPHWLLVAAVVVLAALALGGIFLALAPRRFWLDGALGLAALAPVAVLLAGDGHAGAPHFLDGMSCLWTVLALAALPLSGGAWLLTRVAYSPARAVAVGLISAGVGLLVLQLTCNDGSSRHLLVFHLLPWAALGAVAVLVRRALPTWSYAP